MGWPGSVHDARLFAHSSLYEKAMVGTLLPASTRQLGGVSIPVFLLGDSAYPLMKWLMKPFPHNSSLTADQKTYNYRICRARIVVENAYGRLKGRWRRLMKKNDMHISNIPTVIAACCVLHNLCEVHGEAFNEIWFQNDENSQPAPTATCTNSADGINRPKPIRDGLVRYFNN